MTTTAVTKPGTTIAQLIKKNKNQIEAVLPKHMDVQRMSMLALAEARKNPDLLKADPTSFIGALIQASQLGLEPGAAGLGYLIPRWNSRLQCHEVQFQAGYKGLLKLARNSGEVGAVQGDVVREGDEFAYSKGTNPFLSHTPSTGKRGDVTHVYAVAHLFKSGDYQFEVMTYDDVEEIRKRAQAKGGPWMTDWSQMAVKTCLRRMTKTLPMDAQIIASIAAEESAEANGDGSRLYAPDGMELHVQTPAKESLADKLGTSNIEDVEPEPDDWALMDFDDLAIQATKLAAGKLKTKKACADMIARGDHDSLLGLVRELSS